MLLLKLLGSKEMTLKMLVNWGGDEGETGIYMSSVQCQVS